MFQYSTQLNRDRETLLFIAALLLLIIKLSLKDLWSVVKTYYRKEIAAEVDIVHSLIYPSNNPGRKWVNLALYLGELSSRGVVG